MIKTIPFQDRMEARHSDFNALQASVQTSSDQMIQDAVTNVAPGYAGFALSKTGNSTINIAAGRIYRTDGAVFEMPEAAHRPVSGILPSATKRLVAVVAYGREDDSRSEVRDFLVDLESDTTEPRTVVVERARRAIIDLVPGQESATLPRPAVDSSLLIVGWITLSTTGIESFVQETSTSLPSITKNSARIADLETWRTVLEPRINTIASDITSIKRSLQNSAGQTELVAVMRDVARIKERLEIPEEATDYAADRFLTPAFTDVGNIDQLHQLEEGVRFSHEARNETPIALYNATDGNAFVSGNGLLMPAVARRVIRLASSAGVSDGAIAIAQYGYQTHEMKQMQVARSRMRYGPAYNVCNNSQWWHSGQYDSATNTFRKDGETFLLTSVTGLDNNYDAAWNPMTAHNLFRVQQYWEDTWNDAYWVANAIDRTVGGAQIAQTFLNSQDGWLSSVNLMVTQRGADSDIVISIAKVSDAGLPDKTRLVAQTVLPYANIRVSPTKTIVPLNPTFLEAGQRYAILVTTLGTHRVATVGSNVYSQGTLFYSTDGEYYSGDLTKDLWFELEFLEFVAPRVELELNALTLSGGIASIDVLAGTIVPKSCKIEHQVLINSVWRPLNSITPNLLAGLPPLLRHKVVLSGTTAVAPAIEMPNSRIRVWRQRTVMKHISTLRTLATNASSIRIDLILGAFDPARHTCSMVLRRPDGTTIAATGFVDAPRDHFRMTRSFTFANVTPVVGAYKMEISGTTNNALVQYHVEERVDIAI